MKQLTEAQLAALLKKAYVTGFKYGVAEIAEDADPEEFIDLEEVDSLVTGWVDSV